MFKSLEFSNFLLFFFYRFQFSFVYFLRPVVSYIFMRNYAREIGSLAAEINASDMPHVFSLVTRRFVFPCEHVAWRVKQRVGTDTTRKSNISFFPVLIINVIFKKTKAIVEIRITQKSSFFWNEYRVSLRALLNLWSRFCAMRYIRDSQYIRLNLSHPRPKSGPRFSN